MVTSQCLVTRRTKMGQRWLSGGSQLPTPSRAQCNLLPSVIPASVLLTTHLSVPPLLSQKSSNLPTAPAPRPSVCLSPNGSASHFSQMEATTLPQPPQACLGRPNCPDSWISLLSSPRARHSQSYNIPMLLSLGCPTGSWELLRP